MKVDRQTYIEAVEYLSRINKTKLSDLDLSDFFDDNVVIKEVVEYSTKEGIPITETKLHSLEQAIKEWKFTGLQNKDFISIHDAYWKDPE